MNLLLITLDVILPLEYEMYQRIRNYGGEFGMYVAARDKEYFNNKDNSSLSDHKTDLVLTHTGRNFKRIDYKNFYI